MKDTALNGESLLEKGAYWKEGAIKSNHYGNLIWGRGSLLPERCLLSAIRRLQILGLLAVRVISISQHNMEVVNIFAPSQDKRTFNDYLVTV